MKLEEIIGRKAIAGDRGIIEAQARRRKDNFGFIDIMRSYARRIVLGSAMIFTPALYGCGENSQDNFVEEEQAEMADMGVPADPCEELDCGENSHCVNVDNEVSCQCDKGYLERETGCELIPPPCTACTGEYLSQCVTAQTLETCIPEKQAECLNEKQMGGFCQPLRAFCPAEYSECREGRCSTYPDEGNQDVCRSGTSTDYCFVADTFDIVEEEKAEQTRQLTFGRERNGTVQAPTSCTGNQGIFLGTGPERSYDRVCFDMNWCATPERRVGYIVRGPLAFPPGLLDDESLRNEKGEYIGPRAVMQFEQSNERFEILPSNDPCQSRELARPLFLTGPPSKICMEVVGGSYALSPKIEMVECVCNE